MFYEDAVSPKICRAIIDNFDENNFSSGVVGSEEKNWRVDSKIRNAEIQWAPKFSLVECILTRFIIRANQEAFWNFDITDLEPVQIGRYKDNQFYGTHIDCFIKGPDIIPTGNGGGVVVPVLTQRKISASLLLNDESEYEGGDLIILDEVVKTKKRGSIIVFPSFMTHQVTPVTQGVRYSAVCWMGGPAWK